MRFKDKDLASFWRDPAAYRGRRIPPDVERQLFRKLQMLDAARDLDDLRVPPGNRLESLKGSRAGQYSIRVNGKWRLCFRWTNEGAEEVEFCDYHR